MITRIGLAAGNIWDYLEKNDGGASFDDIIKGLGLEREIALMSVGWLAREGHLILKEDQNGFLVVLTEKRS